MNNSNTPASPRTTRTLLKALDRNDGVEKVVRHSADELLVVNAVLKKGIPQDTQNGDLVQALEKTQDIENTIESSAQDLAAVNQLLEHEVDERISLERELLTTKTALSRAQTALKKK